MEWTIRWRRFKSKESTQLFHVRVSTLYKCFSHHRLCLKPACIFVVLPVLEAFRALLAAEPFRFVKWNIGFFFKLSFITCGMVGFERSGALVPWRILARLCFYFVPHPLVATIDLLKVFNIKSIILPTLWNIYWHSLMEFTENKHLDHDYFLIVLALVASFLWRYIWLGTVQFYYKFLLNYFV